MIKSIFHLNEYYVTFLCEGSFAEVVQLITGKKFASFLIPDIASKSCQTLYMQSLTKLWHLIP